MRSLFRERGIGLIEVLVALFVLGFGMLALAMFGSGLFSESGLVKAKTEALQLAQQRIEQYREDATSGGLSSIASQTEEGIAGVNSIYSRVATVSFVPSSANPQYAALVVTVSWSDKQGSHSIALDSLISAPQAAALGSLIGGGLDGGGLVGDPTGGAVYGEDGETFTSSGTTQDLSDDYGVAGTKVYLEEPDYVLTDKDGNVLLRSQSVFSTVTGRVYIDGGDVSEANIIVQPSDVGVCPKTLATDAEGNLIVDGSGATQTEVREIRYVSGAIMDLEEGESTEGTLLYTYFTYNCFFGTGWYGNVGVLRTDSTNSNDRICGGDPLEADNGTEESRHPQLMGARTYRGYSPQFDFNDIDNDGILNEPAIDGNGNRIYLSDGMAEGDVYGETSRAAVDSPNTHDFLITVITGTASDSDCQPQLALSGNEEFENNNGYFICIYDENGNKSCPSTLPEDLGYQVTTAPRTITGTISVPEGETVGTDSLSLTTSQVEACDIADDLTWSCTVYDVGAGWSGTITLSSSDLEICSVSSFTFNGVVENIDGYEFSVASACAGGASFYSVSGVVRNTNNTNTIDLSGISVVTSPSGEGSCAILGTRELEPNGETEFSCTVAANFNGAIDLDQAPTKVSARGRVSTARVTSTPDFSGAPVTENLTGQVISVN